MSSSNHHLLFADLALKHTGFGEVLPGASAVIIDEAHQVPETAMRFFFSRGRQCLAGPRTGPRQPGRLR